MFKLFFKYLDEFLVFCMDDLLIHSQTDKEHLKHLQLVFETFRENGENLKCPNMSSSKMSKCLILQKMK